MTLPELFAKHPLPWTCECDCMDHWFQDAANEYIDFDDVIAALNALPRPKSEEELATMTTKGPNATRPEPAMPPKTIELDGVDRPVAEPAPAAQVGERVARWTDDDVRVQKALWAAVALRKLREIAKERPTAPASHVVEAMEHAMLRGLDLKATPAAGRDAVIEECKAAVRTLWGKTIRSLDFDCAAVCEELDALKSPPAKGDEGDAPVACKACGGSRTVTGCAGAPPCPACGGTGKDCEVYGRAHERDSLRSQLVMYRDTLADLHKLCGREGEPTTHGLDYTTVIGAELRALRSQLADARAEEKTALNAFVLLKRSTERNVKNIYEALTSLDLAQQSASALFPEAQRQERGA